jgi:hypothetical protein
MSVKPLKRQAARRQTISDRDFFGEIGMWGLSRMNRAEASKIDLLRPANLRFVGRKERRSPPFQWICKPCYRAIVFVAIMLKCAQKALNQPRFSGQLGQVRYLVTFRSVGLHV